jgi:hypothetical protein
MELLNYVQMKITADFFNINIFVVYLVTLIVSDRLCGLVVEFLATDTEVSGSIPGASRFSGSHRIWNGVHSAS